MLFPVPYCCEVLSATREHCLPVVGWSVGQTDWGYSTTTTTGKGAVLVVSRLIKKEIEVVDNRIKD